MINKKFVAGLLLMVMVLFTACAPAATPTQAPAQEPAQEAPASDVQVVKIGGLYPLTGTDAINGQNFKLAHDFATKVINDAGGIACLNGAKIEMVYGDTQSKSEIGNSETERLVTQDKVTAIVGALHSHVVLPATEITEKYEVPFIVANSIANKIVERGLKYTFMTMSNMQQLGKANTEMAAKLGAKTGVVVTMNIAFGEEAKLAWEPLLPAAGIEMLDSLVYQNGGTDFTDTILKLKSLDPDVVFLLANTNDSILWTRQLQENDYYPKMALINMGSGFLDPNYVATVGATAAEGTFVTWDWVPNINLPGAKEKSDEFLKETGKTIAGLNTTVSTMYLLKDALEKACSTDPKVLAEVLRTTTFSSEGALWAYQWSSVSFDEKGAVAGSAVVAQYQNGVPMAVWPENVAITQPIWPAPSWDER